MHHAMLEGCTADSMQMGWTSHKRHRAGDGVFVLVCEGGEDGLGDGTRMDQRTVSRENTDRLVFFKCWEVVSMNVSSNFGTLR
jgi:hypothetical protein